MWLFFIMIGCSLGLCYLVAGLDELCIAIGKNSSRFWWFTGDPGDRRYEFIGKLLFLSEHKRVDQYLNPISEKKRKAKQKQ